MGQAAFLASLLSTTIAFGGGTFSSPCPASGGRPQGLRADCAEDHGRSGSEPRFANTPTPGEAVDPNEASRTRLRGAGESIRASSAALCPSGVSLRRAAVPPPADDVAPSLVGGVAPAKCCPDADVNMAARLAGGIKEVWHLKNGIANISSRPGRALGSVRNMQVTRSLAESVRFTLDGQLHSLR